MPIDRDALLAWPFPDKEHAYTDRDTILYALGLGLGSDPMDEDQLRFVYEEGLEALPTMAVILGYPGFWLRDPKVGADWKRLLHGEQGIELFAPLPAAGTVIGRSRVTEVIDKGADKGALVFTERDVVDGTSGELLCRVSATAFLRGDGGFGGSSGPAPAPHPIPERAPDLVCDLPTLPQSALIYRLSGDYNPLHAAPAIAAAAGFPRPILHGLCTFGIAGHALLKDLCGYRTERLKAMRARFTSPVFPGETIRTEIWHEAGGAAFRASVVERDVVVLNNGRVDVGTA